MPKITGTSFELTIEYSPSAPPAIRAGDVVELKSGGPNMTVSSTSNNYACCHWFNANGEVQADVFALVTLERSKS